MLRENEITNSTFTLTRRLVQGDYKIWIRGTFANEAQTRWGAAITLTVEGPPLILEPMLLDGKWVKWPPAETTVQYEIWVDRLDQYGKLATHGIIHVTRLEVSGFSVDGMKAGKYRFWIRGILDVAGSEVATQWSYVTVELLDGIQTLSLRLARRCLDYSHNLIAFEGVYGNCGQFRIVATKYDKQARVLNGCNRAKPQSSTITTRSLH